MSDVLDQLADDLSRDLHRITKRFRTPVKLTLVIRQPEIPGDSGIVIGNDDYDAAIAEIQRQRVTGTEHGGKR